MTFGELLQQRRVAARISLRDLGRYVGLSAVYISDIEGGSRRPPASSIIVKMAERLGVDPEPLLQASVAQRNTVELPLPKDDKSKRVEAALALARKWDQLGDDDLDKITRILSEADEVG
jgi:transcriptional regulator with XRE-family HTH domain